MFNACEQFAQLLKAAMSRRKLSMSDLSCMTGIEEATIYGYLRCRVAPTLNEIYMLCAVMNVKSSELLGF